MRILDVCDPTEEGSVREDAVELERPEFLDSAVEADAVAEVNDESGL